MLSACNGSDGWCYTSDPDTYTAAKTIEVVANTPTEVNGDGSDSKFLGVANKSRWINGNVFVKEQDIIRLSATGSIVISSPYGLATGGTAAQDGNTEVYHAILNGGDLSAYYDNGGRGTKYFISPRNISQTVIIDPTTKQNVKFSAGQNITVTTEACAVGDTSRVCSTTDGLVANDAVCPTKWTWDNYWKYTTVRCTRKGRSSFNITRPNQCKVREISGACSKNKQNYWDCDTAFETNTQYNTNGLSNDSCSTYNCSNNSSNPGSCYNITDYKGFTVDPGSGYCGGRKDRCSGTMVSKTKHVNDDSSYNIIPPALNSCGTTDTCWNTGGYNLYAIPQAMACPGGDNCVHLNNSTGGQSFSSSQGELSLKIIDPNVNATPDAAYLANLRQTYSDNNATIDSLILTNTTNELSLDSEKVKVSNYGGLDYSKVKILQDESLLYSAYLSVAGYPSIVSSLDDIAAGLGILLTNATNFNNEVAPPSVSKADGTLTLVKNNLGTLTPKASNLSTSITDAEDYSRVDFVTYKTDLENMLSSMTNASNNVSDSTTIAYARIKADSVSPNSQSNITNLWNIKNGLSDLQNSLYSYAYQLSVRPVVNDVTGQISDPATGGPTVLDPWYPVLQTINPQIDDLLVLANNLTDDSSLAPSSGGPSAQDEADLQDLKVELATLENELAITIAEFSVYMQSGYKSNYGIAVYNNKINSLNYKIDDLNSKIAELENKIQANSAPPSTGEGSVIEYKNGLIPLLEAIKGDVNIALGNYANIKANENTINNLLANNVTLEQEIRTINNSDPGQGVGGYTVYVKSDPYIVSNGEFLEAIITPVNDPNLDESKNIDLGAVSALVSSQPAPISGTIWYRFKDPDGDYTNNLGSYTATAGTVQMENSFSMLFVKLVNTVKYTITMAAETMFDNLTCSSRTTVTGVNSVSTTCVDYMSALRSMLILYVIIFGIMFLFGLIKTDYLDFLIRVIKMSVIIILMQKSSFAFFYTYMFSGFTDLANTLISNILNLPSDNPFAFLNQTIAILLLDGTTYIKVVCLMFQGLLGFVVFFVILQSVAAFISAIFNALKVYLMSFIGIGMCMALAPFFLAFLLFDRTKYLYDNWFNALMRFTMDPVILFLGIIILNEMLLINLHQLFNFSACFKCTFPFTIEIPGLYAPGIGPLFCIPWFTPWSVDNIGGGIPFIIFMAIPLVVNLSLITNVMDVYSTKMAKEITGKIFGQGVTGSSSMGAKGAGTMGGGLKRFADRAKKSAGYVKSAAKGVFMVGKVGAKTVGYIGRRGGALVGRVANVATLGGASWAYKKTGMKRNVNKMSHMASAGPSKALKGVINMSQKAKGVFTPSSIKNMFNKK